MNEYSVTNLAQRLDGFDSKSASYATDFVDALLNSARGVGTSDVHLQPTRDGLDLRWRIDGVLQRIGCFAAGDAADVVARLKVMAELLTYRTDVPQEGRIRNVSDSLEMRVSTFPTLYGERAVIRLFASSDKFLYPDELGLPGEVTSQLLRLLGDEKSAVLYFQQAI